MVAAQLVSAYVPCVIQLLRPVNICRGAGAWTEQEAHRIYREKLVKLRDLYVGQLSHLKHVLLERRRQFLLEWQAAGGSKEEGLYVTQTAPRCVQFIAV